MNDKNPGTAPAVDEKAPLSVGDAVVVYWHGYGRSETHAIETKIRRIGKMYFSVESAELVMRFNIQTMNHSSGSGYGAMHFVVRAGSAKAVQYLRLAREWESRQRADYAVFTWDRDKTRVNRMAAIAALQAVEGDA